MSLHEFNQIPTSQQQKSIVYMSRESVPVATCLRRLANWCLSNGVDISEEGQKLQSDFKKKISVAYRDFFREVIESIYVCGFVPWYEGICDGIKVPKVLPLGSYVWRVEAQVDMTGRKQDAEEERARKRYKRDMYVYRISILHGEVKEEAVNIINYVPPRLNAPISPMQGLFFKYLTLQAATQMMHEISQFNSKKHVLFTEKINFNELGTTSGIALLDEFRQYTLTGKFSERDSTRFRTRTGQVLSNVNDANHFWVQDQFNDADFIRHILPPNMEATEMQQIVIDDYFLQQSGWFDHAVHMFFDLPYSITTQSTRRDRMTNQETRVLSEEQYTNIRCLCDFLQSVGEATYVKLYTCKDCTFYLQARPRLSIDSADDVKKLVECGVFSVKDNVKIRDLFFQK